MHKPAKHANTQVATDTDVEANERLKHGGVQVKPSELDDMIDRLGYRRDPASRCAGISTYLATGRTFQNVNFRVREKDTGMSAFHYLARRDQNFQQLQDLREMTFCVVNAAIWGI